MNDQSRQHLKNRVNLLVSEIKRDMNLESMAGRYQLMKIISSEEYNHQLFLEFIEKMDMWGYKTKHDNNKFTISWSDV